ncbi:MAG TPA: DUF4197 domain-containing protein [Sphingobacteriaceae bacterium]
MKRTILGVIAFFALISLHDRASGQTGVFSRPTGPEMATGLREALEAGVAAGTERLSAADGFLKNPSVKILFPPDAAKVESTLRGIGMGKLCDDFIISMNRAAEDAAKEAKPIFVAAIRDMSLADAAALLMAKEQDAATTYFRKETSGLLQERFRPVISASLEKTGATKHWTEIISRYNKVPFVKKMNPDLAAYATGKAIDGLFTEVAREELKIRQSASARTSPLLQKVFGFAQKAG